MHIAPPEVSAAITEALPGIKASLNQNSFSAALAQIITSYSPDGPELRKSVTDAVCTLADNYADILDDSLKSINDPVDPEADYFPSISDFIFTLARYATDQVIAEHPTADEKRLLNDFIPISAVVVTYGAVRCHKHIKSAVNGASHG
ncbi:MAG: hypothetical protein H7Y05_00530 [Steroidobacteraceae bacterium]|nr:hypothetical protein [Deltaproteobacteria bacterium]